MVVCSITAVFCPIAIDYGNRGSMSIDRRSYRWRDRILGSNYPDSDNQIIYLYYNEANSLIMLGLSKFSSRSSFDNPESATLK